MSVFRNDFFWSFSSSVMAALLRLAVVPLLLVASPTTAAWAACTGSSPTWTTTPDYASVSTCISNAASGDTINVSAGSATWSSTLSFSKAITLIGAGQGSTVITNSAGILIEVQNPGGNFVRVGQMTISSSDNQGPIISISGPASQVRIDHITFNKGDAAVGTNHISAIRTGTGPVYGVVDHCSFYNNKRPYFAMDHRSTDGSAWGSVAWSEFLANPSSFPGSNKMMYFEDNQFVWDASLTDSNAQGALYGQYGGKAVFRYNTFTGFYTYVDAHGDTPDYGTIYYELYNNTFKESDTFGGAQDIVGMRGGQLIAHDNTFSGGTLPFGMTVYWTTDVTSGLGHTVKNTYYWNNSWNGDTNQSNLVKVIDSGQTPVGYSSTYIRLNQEYFLQAPQSYARYTYPHPLTNRSAPAAPSNLSVVLH
jgi:hypothetical protein